MSKFNTTNSNLFNNNNKEVIPDWMQNLTDNLMIKQREVQELEADTRGVFASDMQQVYRAEMTADPRYLENTYGESKLLADSKIMLAKFLSNKYYKVVNASPSVNRISLQVQIDGVPAYFNFPFEVNSSKLRTSPLFYVEDSEYPFSKAGLNECLSDIKNGTLKTAAKPEAVGKAYIINREEIIRRYNGSLRLATDAINKHLKESTIIGAGSNSYASFVDIDQLFPQMEKQAGEERMPEFHFSPNQEHVATNEMKPANVLAVEASKILKENFKDFKIKASNRMGNNLIVKASVLANTGISSDIDFNFNIVNEKVESVKETKINEKTMEFKQLIASVNSVENLALNKYLLNNKTQSQLSSGSVLTKKEIVSKLFKIVEASKIDNLVDNWIDKGLISPLNSSSYATNHSFEELLASSDINTMSDDEVQDIESYEKHFGQGLEVETDLIKPTDEVREVEDNGSDEQRLFNANSYINKNLKQYKVASFEKIQNNVYRMNVQFVNRKAGTKHNVPFEITFDGSKVESCVASLGNKKVTLSKLVEAFTNNKVLSLYLQDKSNLNAGPIVISSNEMKRRLSSVVTANKVDSILNSWIGDGTISLINSSTLASDKSFSELLSLVSDEDIVTEDERAEVEYRKKHFGKEIKVSTDDKIDDTGVREAEETWNQERMRLAASNEIGKLFNEYKFNSIGQSDENYFVTATVRNPLNGSPISLSFDFMMSGGKLGKLTSVSHGNDSVEVSKTKELLAKYTSEASLKFAEQNKVSVKNHNVMISKTNLENKLRTVASLDKVNSLIEKFVSNDTIQKINNATFASKYTIAELIAQVSDELSVEDGKEEMLLAAKTEHKLSLDGNHLKDNDSRELQNTIRELSPQMVVAKNKLINNVKEASNKNQLTSKKSDLFITALESAKTIQDLEAISRQLNSYLK